MSKSIKFSHNNSIDESLQSEKKEFKNVITIDVLKLKTKVRTVLAIALTSIALILSFTTNNIFYKEIFTVVVIFSGVIIIKYLGESKTKKTIKKK